MLFLQDEVLLQRHVAVVMVHHGGHWGGTEIKHGGAGGVKRN
jgi:hypothetical protein